MQAMPHNSMVKKTALYTFDMRQLLLIAIKDQLFGFMFSIQSQVFS